MRVAFLCSVVLLAVPTSREAQTPASGQTVVRGVVFDSLEMRPLREATVQMLDTSGIAWSKIVNTDSTGTFEFTGAPDGAYLIGFFHAKLDSLGLASQTLRLNVRAGPPIQLRLAIPSARAIARALCGRNSTSDSTGLFLGYVRGADNSMPRPNGTVVMRWAEIVIAKNTISRNIPSIEVSSGPSGLAAVCGLPMNTTILMQGASAADSSGAFEIAMPSTGFYHRDIFVATLTRTSVATSDSTPPVAVLRGLGRVRGRVTGATRRPIAGARVTVWGTGMVTTTNADGEFTLGNLPAGTHALEVRAVGFMPAQQPVDIVQGAPGAAEVELANLGITLDTIKVTAERLYTSRRRADMERRMRSGVGRFIDEKEIERRNPMFLSDLLRMVPGVMVVPGQVGGDDILMRGGLGFGSGLCRPDLYIDGVRVVNDPSFPLNSLVWVSELQAVEVYNRAALVPGEFHSMSGCGVIVIWTGGRR
jgi:hypothetical protein